MKYQHGTQACYVHDRCRCRPCTDAVVTAERERYHRVEPAFVSATPVREHLKSLAKRGIGTKNAAVLAGVSEGFVRRVLFGEKGKPPAKRVKRELSEKVLAVKASEGADLGRVDAKATAFRVNKLRAHGFSLNEIGRRIGSNHFLAPGKSTSRKTERLVKELYDLELGGARESIDSERERVEDIFDKIADSVSIRHQRDWVEFAECRKYPTYIWFPADDDRLCEAQAKKICNLCGVREKCLAANLNEQDGIFGGLNPRERLELTGVNQ